MGLQMPMPKNAAENQERVSALPDLSHKVYAAVHRAKKPLDSLEISDAVGLKPVQTNGAVSILRDRNLLCDATGEDKGIITSAKAEGWEVDLAQRNAKPSKPKKSSEKGWRIEASESFRRKKPLDADEPLHPEAECGFYVVSPDGRVVAFYARRAYAEKSLVKHKAG